MTDKDDATFPEPDEGQGSGAAPEATGPDASDAEHLDGAPSSAGSSGPAPSGGTQEADDFTIDDILGAEQTAEAAAEDQKFADLESALLNDLKRLQAEYANYRRRTEEQREREIERAKGEAAKGLIPVLDDLDRAVKHGDIEDGTPFAAIGEKLRSVAERLGVVAYGEAGEPFDPQHHEAIFQAPTPGTTQPTVLEVVELGYRLGSVELRPAKVVVAVPAE
jgi:molecular chaperone GrpE